ncbi:MAG: hypothetical protein LBR73_07105 [Oscillospiraceae bacterium]|nr:hypothetical protein [Oscillospiraceae bacterium]
MMDKIEVEVDAIRRAFYEKTQNMDAEERRKFYEARCNALNEKYGIHTAPEKVVTHDYPQQRAG